MNNKYTLKTDLRIEPILLSLTDDNHNDLISQLIQGLQDYDKDLVAKLKRYQWLTDTQLSGRVASIETLKKEFPEMVFDEYLPITDPDELIDYIHMFITKKKQRFLSVKFTELSDTIRSQGLNDSMVEEIYKYLSLSETETGYQSITKDFKEFYMHKVEMKGLSFLSTELNSLTGGILPGQICTILGAPGSMKTTYSSNIAYNAIKEGKNVLYLSLEEEPATLYSKWLSRASVDVGSPLPHQDIIKHTLEEKDLNIFMERVIPYFEELPGKLYIVGEQDLSNYSLTSLESKFKEVDKQAKEETGHGIDILVVDHIQLLKFAVSGLSESTVINMYVSFFRQQSLSWLHEKRGIIVIMLSQANREGLAYASKHDGMYKSLHVAEASEVERASAYIISVYTDPEIQTTKQLKIGAVKLRGSRLPITTTAVYADGEFYNVGDQVIPESQEYSSDDLFGPNSEIQQTTPLTDEDMFDSGILDDLNI